MIVSGAPERTPNHANEILEMAFDMLALINTLRDPISGKPMKIRIGKIILKFKFCLKWHGLLLKSESDCKKIEYLIFFNGIYHSCKNSIKIMKNNTAGLNNPEKTVLKF
jgi:hypothetical protein